MNLTFADRFVVSLLLGSLVIYFVQKHYQILFNLTPSLPYHVFLIKKGEPVRRGDLMAFRWRGGLGYDKGVTMIKKIAATSGDIVIRKERDFYVDGYRIARAAEQNIVNIAYQTAGNKNLDAAQGGPVAQGQYFVVATHPASLDSRYSQFGTVDNQQVIGRAYPIW